MIALYKYVQKKRRQQRVTPTPSPPTDATTSNVVASPDDGSQTLIAEANRTSQQRKEEKKRQRIHRWKLVFGLFLPCFLAAVDTTIVAPALTTIGSSFSRLGGELNWVVTAYTLTYASFIPVFGQLADIYGRHAALQLSMVCMLVGSALCAGAQAWGMLLLGRAFQGIGAAGTFNLAKIIFSDGVSLEENSKTNSIFSLLFGLCYAVGPVIGGYLTNTNWRYCFVLSTAVAAASHVVIFFLLHPVLKPGRYTFKELRSAISSGTATIDIVGALLFILGTGPVILGITWAGTTYAWDSAAVLVPVVVGGLIFASFFFYEYLLEPGRLIARALPKAVPMVPWVLFQKKDAFLLVVINIATGAALYSAFYFVSIYWTLAEGMSSSDAGVQLLYYTPGLGTGVYAAMFMCNRFPAQTFYPLLSGSVIEAVGMGLLTYAVTTHDKAFVNGMLALAGVGTGLRLMPTTLHAAGIWPTRLAAIMSLMMFCTPFGGTIAIGIMWSVFSNKFTSALQHLSADLGSSASHLSIHDLGSIASIDALPEPAKSYVRNKATDAVMWAFISVLPLMGLCVLAAVMLGNVWIKQKAGEESEGEGAVLYGSFALAALKGQTRVARQPLDRPDEEIIEWEKGDKRAADSPA